MSESSNNKIPITKEQNFEMFLQKVAGSELSALNEKQVDEVLSQRRQIHQYIHEDRSQSKKQEFSTFVITLIFIILIIAGVLFLHPAYFKETLAVLIGFAGGFGIGRSSKDRE